jgi:ATP-dependent helicase/nuclease subunit A
MAEARSRARDAEAGEHRRLLYVAMTRAAQRLIIGGFEGGRGRPADCWHNLVRIGLDPALRQEPAPWNPQEIVWRLGEAAEPDLGVALAAQVDEATPDWLRTSPPPEFAPVALAPSRLTSASALAVSSVDRRRRAEEGLLAHSLLQELPDIPPDRRRAAAERFLEPDAAAGARRNRLIDRVLDILAQPALGPLFAPGSRAEVAVAGTLARPGRPDLVYSGRIDRLAVTESAVLIADFKTGADPGQAPEAYVAQLALYNAALAPLYPTREIRTMLIWVESGRFELIRSQALDEALRRAVDGPSLRKGSP